MTFEEWWEETIAPKGQGLCRYDKAEAAWDEQQKRIDELELLLINNWSGEIDELYALFEGKYTKTFLSLKEESE